MTGRQRMKNIINRQPTDRISWTTLSDSVTRSIMPDHIRKMPITDFYRYIGCDILQFGNFSESLCVHYPYRLVQPVVKEEYTDSDGNYVKKFVTDWGELVSIYNKSHPINILCKQ